MVLMLCFFTFENVRAQKDITRDEVYKTADEFYFSPQFITSSDIKLNIARIIAIDREKQVIYDACCCDTEVNAYQYAQSTQKGNSELFQLIKNENGLQTFQINPKDITIRGGSSAYRYVGLRSVEQMDLNYSCDLRRAQVFWGQMSFLIPNRFLYKQDIQVSKKLTDLTEHAVFRDSVISSSEILIDKTNIAWGTELDLIELVKQELASKKGYRLLSQGFKQVNGKRYAYFEASYESIFSDYYFGQIYFPDNRNKIVTLTYKGKLLLQKTEDLQKQMSGMIQSIVIQK